MIKKNKIITLFTVSILIGAVIFFACKKEESKDEQKQQKDVSNGYEYKFFKETLYVPSFSFNSFEELKLLVEEYSQKYNVNIPSVAKAAKSANIALYHDVKPFSKDFEIDELTWQKLDSLISLLLNINDPLDPLVDQILAEISFLLHLDITNPYEWMEADVAALVEFGESLHSIEGYENLTEEERADCFVLAMYLLRFEEEGPSYVPQGCPCWDAYNDTYDTLTENFAWDMATCLAATIFSPIAGGICG